MARDHRQVRARRRWCSASRTPAPRLSICSGRDVWRSVLVPDPVRARARRTAARRRRRRRRGRRARRSASRRPRRFQTKATKIGSEHDRVDLRRDPEAERAERRAGRGRRRAPRAPPRRAPPARGRSASARRSRARAARAPRARSAAASRRVRRPVADERERDERDHGHPADRHQRSRRRGRTKPARRPREAISDGSAKTGSAAGGYSMREVAVGHLPARRSRRRSAGRPACR